MSSIEEILGRVTEGMNLEMKDMSVSDHLMMLAEHQRSLAIGMKWAEESGDYNLKDHEDISMPLYVLMCDAASKFMDETTATLLFILLGLVIRLAVQKGYEKGKREALASLVLEEGGK